MNIYKEEELQKIKKAKETNEKLEGFFESKRNDWNETLDPLFQVLKIDLENPKNFKEIIEAQALALTYRQNLNDQISLFLTKRSKESSKIKRLRQDKFIFYATGFGIKTNLGEKSILIDGHLAENDRTMELIENYIEFLRSCVKNLESFGFTIKNMVDLMNYLGKMN